MPRLNRHRIRSWLEEHNWTVLRLAQECSALGDDMIPEGTMRNAVNGIDTMRPGRIRLICQVTARQGDGIPYSQLTVDDRDDYRHGKIDNYDRELLARIGDLCERLRDIGHELMYLASEVTNVGVDMVRRANMPGPPVDSTDETP